MVRFSESWAPFVHRRSAWMHISNVKFFSFSWFPPLANAALLEAELAPKRDGAPGEATALEALLRGDSLLEKKNSLCKEEETLLEIQVIAPTSHTALCISKGMCPHCLCFVHGRGSWRQRRTATDSTTTTTLKSTPRRGKTGTEAKWERVRTQGLKTQIATILCCKHCKRALKHLCCCGF